MLSGAGIGAPRPTHRPRREATVTKGGYRRRSNHSSVVRQARHEPPYPPGDGRGVLAHPRFCRNSTSVYTDAQERIRRGSATARATAVHAARPACGWRVVGANEGWGPSFPTIVGPPDDKDLGVFGQGSVLSPGLTPVDGVHRTAKVLCHPDLRLRAISRRLRGRDVSGSLSRSTTTPVPHRASLGNEISGVSPARHARSLRRQPGSGTRAPTCPSRASNTRRPASAAAARRDRRVTTRRRGWRVVGANAVSGPSLPPILKIVYAKVLDVFGQGSARRSNRGDR